MKFNGVPELPPEMPPEEQVEVLNRPWEYNFRVNLAGLRELQGISQTGLAKTLKAKGLPFHQQTVQRMEDGKRPVRLNEAFVIAEALNVEVETLLSPAKSQPVELEIRFTAERMMKELKGFLEDWLDPIEPAGRALLSLVHIVLPNVQAATESEAAPDRRTIWMWAVLIKLLDALDALMVAYKEVSGLANDSVDAAKALQPGAPRRIAWALNLHDADGDFEAALGTLLSEDQACLRDLPARLNPFRIARSKTTLEEILKMEMV